MHEERGTSWHFVMSIVKYRESHCVTKVTEHFLTSIRLNAHLNECNPGYSCFACLYSLALILMGTVFLSGLSNCQFECFTTHFWDTRGRKAALRFVELIRAFIFIFFQLYPLLTWPSPSAPTPLALSKISRKSKTLLTLSSDNSVPIGSGML